MKTPFCFLLRSGERGAFLTPLSAALPVLLVGTLINQGKSVETRSPDVALKRFENADLMRPTADRSTVDGGGVVNHQTSPPHAALRR